MTILDISIEGKSKTICHDVVDGCVYAGLIDGLSSLLT